MDNPCIATTAQWFPHFLQQGWFNYLGFVCGIAVINNIGANIIATQIVLNTGPGGDTGYVATKELVLLFMTVLVILQVR